VRFSVSTEPVKGSLFYRDVNLPFIEAVKDPSTIRWRYGSVRSGSLPPVWLAHMMEPGRAALAKAQSTAP
jgi:hypothetical protein